MFDVGRSMFDVNHFLFRSGWIHVAKAALKPETLNADIRDLNPIPRNPPPSNLSLKPET